MNTHWQLGQNIFFDGVGNDSIRNLAVTSKTGHLLGTYVTPESNSTSQHIRLETAAGALFQPRALAETSLNIQKDADIATIDGTDDFVAVWASNHSTFFRIYARRYSVNASQGIGAPYAEILVSGENGHYVAPRVIYNPDSKLIFVSWVSVTTKAIQGIYLNADTLEELSYPLTISTTIYTAYHDTYGTVELGTHLTANIVLMNKNSSVILAYQKDINNIAFSNIDKPTNGNVPISELLTYPRSNMGKFHAAYNEKTSKIMLVYINTNNVYGETLRLFGSKDNLTEPLAEVRLNQALAVCQFPYIHKRLTPTNEYEFFVTWSAAAAGIFYNKFDGDFNQTSSEFVINANTAAASNAYPKVASSTNQLAIMFQSNKNDASVLNYVGVINYVKSLI